MADEQPILMRVSVLAHIMMHYADWFISASQVMIDSAPLAPSVAREHISDKLPKLIELRNKIDELVKVAAEHAG